MTNILEKEIHVTYIPGDPGVPGSPGSPAKPGRTVYETREVCTVVQNGSFSLRRVVDQWGVEHIVEVPSDGSATSTYVCRTERVAVQLPPSPAVPPVPPVPATPDQTIQDFNLGWNAGARSIQSIRGNGAASFQIPDSTVSAVVGLNDFDNSPDYREIAYAFYFAGGLLRVYERGQEVATIGSYSGSDTFGLERSAGVVTYYQNGEAVYTSTQPSTLPLFLDASLYSGGDQVLNATIGELSSSAGALLPLTGTAGGGVGTTYALSATSLLPLTGSSTFAQGSAGALLPLTGFASGARVGSVAVALEPLTGFSESGALVPSYALSATALSQLSGSSTGLTGQIGGATTALRPLTGGVVASRIYGESATYFMPLTGTSHAYEGSFVAVLGAVGAFDDTPSASLDTTASLTFGAEAGMAIDAQRQLNDELLFSAQVETTATAPVELAASVQGSAQVTLALAVERRLSASAQSTADVQATLAVKRLLAASIEAASAASASLAVKRQLAASALSTASIQLTLDVRRNPGVLFLQSASEVQLALAVKRQLSASFASTSTVSASVQRAVPLELPMTSSWSMSIERGIVFAPALSEIAYYTDGARSTTNSLESRTVLLPAVNAVSVEMDDA